MALLVGEGDGRDLGGPEEQPEGGADDRERARPSATASPGGGPWTRSAGARQLASRCAQKARVPPTQATTATAMPATGCTAVASTVTRIGPRMKTASSSTASSAYAVCTSAGRSSTCDHRARTAEPTWGRQAPAHAARTYVDPIGQSACTETTSSETAVPNPRLATARTRPCPKRSSSRPCRIARPAFAIMNAAETAPATPYRPVAPETSSTIPRPTMEIGSRATRPVGRSGARPAGRAPAGRT